jgi:hypothetical protein
VNFYGDSNFFQLRGVESLEQDSVLFWISFGVTTALIFIHLRVIWTHPDPGFVDSRENDFDEVIID